MQINWLEYDIYIHGGADCKIYFMDTDRKHNRLMIGGSDKYSGQWFTNECGQPPLQSTSKTKCKDASTSLLVFFFQKWAARTRLEAYSWSKRRKRDRTSDTAARIILKNLNVTIDLSEYQTYLE